LSIDEKLLSKPQLDAIIPSIEEARTIPAEPFYRVELGPIIALFAGARPRMVLFAKRFKKRVTLPSIAIFITHLSGIRYTTGLTSCWQKI
jgi:hypothetical protein